MDELSFSRRWRAAVVTLGAALPALGSCSLSAPAYDEYAKLRPTGGSPSSGAGAGPVDNGGTASGGSETQPQGGGDAGRGGEAGAAGVENEAGSGTGGSGAGSGGVGGATAGSAGASGVGGSGGSGGAGGNDGCRTSGTELCDGFELGQLDSAIWETSTQVATLEVDSTRPHRGSYSVHIRATPGQRNVALLNEDVTFPAPANSFYARAFVYFSPGLPGGAGSNYQTAFIMAKGQNDVGSVEAGVGFAGGDRQWLGYTIFVGPPFFQFGPWSATRVTPGSWLCLEVFEDGSSSQTERRQVWLNGDELKELSTDSAQAAGSESNHRSPAFNRVSFGLNQFFTSPTLTDMWVDDVRVSRSRIGCDD